MSGPTNADAWGLPGVLKYFETERTTTDHVYPSEWFFLKDKLREGLSVLDIGCAQGGFASVLGEHLNDFSYTGLDINSEMIENARGKHPDATFHIMNEGDFSVLGDRRFDLVLVLGILHLHETWRQTIEAAWRHTGGGLIFDLREISGPSIEDKQRSFFRMNFGGGGDDHNEATLPYNLINSAEALETVERIGAEAEVIKNYGYIHGVSGSAQCPVDSAMFNTWCLDRTC